MRATKLIYRYNEELDEDEEVQVPYFSKDWAQSVLDDMENANWHTARSVFEEFILLLPNVYQQVDKQTKSKMEKAVKVWEQEF